MAARLEFHHLIILFGGILLLLAVSSFLGFLWFGDSRSAIWRTILLDGWLIRTVTILSLAIRTTVAMQLVDCVSMIAALALEHGQSPLPNTAALSMMRFQNSGPLGLLFRLWPIGTSVRGLVLVIPTSLLAITSICLQFTSTALLSDVSSGFVRVASGETSVLYTQSNAHNLEPNKNKSTILAGARSTMSGHHLYSSPIFPVFAEYTEKPSRADVGDGVVDTGLAMRAFLPIASQNERTQLRDYSGPATLFDTRVVCMRPDPSKTSFRFWTHADGKLRPFLSGRVGTSRTASRFNGTASLNLNCTFGIPAYDRGEWPISLCIPANVKKNNFGLISAMEPFPPAEPPESVRGYGRRDSFLLINATGSVDDWSLFRQNQTDRSPTNSWTLLDLVSEREDKEWLYLKSTNSPSIGFAISLCHSSMDHINAVISASSTISNNADTTNIFEPTVSWVSSNETFVTGSVRQQIITTDPSGHHHEQHNRGILSMNSLDSWIGYNTEGAYTRRDAAKPRDLSVNLDVFVKDSDRTLILCSTCECPQCQLHTNITYLHTTRAAVVNDIFQSTTGNAALAMQGLITMMSSQIYYDQLEFFSLAMPANMSYDVPVLRPVGKTFFTITMVLVGIHILVVLATVVAFWGGTEYTLLGNAWHVVAQFQSLSLSQPYSQSPFQYQSPFQSPSQFPSRGAPGHGGPGGRDLNRQDTGTDTGTEMGTGTGMGMEEIQMESWFRDQKSRDILIRRKMRDQGVSRVLVGLEEKNGWIGMVVKGFLAGRKERKRKERKRGGRRNTGNPTQQQQQGGGESDSQTLTS